MFNMEEVQSNNKSENKPSVPVHEVLEVYGTLTLKILTLIVAVIGGILGYLLIDSVTLNQKQAEIEHKQVQLAISISKESSPKVQADMLEILKAAYTSKTNSDHMESLIKTMEKNIHIALSTEESINALNAKKLDLAKDASNTEISEEKKSKLNLAKKEIEEELSLLQSRPPITKKIESPEISNVSVAIIVGHKQSSPGSSNKETNITEYSMAMEFSSLLVTELTKLGVTSTVIYRRTYSELPSYVNSVNPKLSISIHAGAFNARTSGTKVLYQANNEASEKMANAILQATTESLGLPNRGISPKGSEDRGGYFLTNVKSPSVILEAFFIDNNLDLRTYQEKKNKLASNISLALKELISK